MTKTKAEVSVVVDSNEATMSDALKYVRNHPDVSDWHISDLDVGDLIVAESVCIEIKGVSDFASSLTEGKKRLYNQAKDMRDSDYEYTFILIRGDIGDFEDLEYGPTPEALRGAMSSITIRYGVPVIPVGDMETLIDISTRYGRKTQEESSSSTFTAGSVTDKEAPTEVRMLSGIEGIDEVSAWNLFSNFGSIESILKASIEEIMETPNIGETRAKKVKSALSGTESENSTNKSWTA